MKYFVRLQSFRPVSDKDVIVTEATPGEVSMVKWAADSCTAAHLEKFFGWEQGQVNIWPRESQPRGKDIVTLVVECQYEPSFGSYKYRFWREETVNN